MITLYNVISKDGFIAREDGSEDFIPDEVWDEFIELCKNYDGVVISRKTYEAIQTYSTDMIAKFENLSVKKIIVSHNNQFKIKPGYVLTTSVDEAIQAGENLLITSGPGLNSEFMRANLVNKVTFNVLPESIGGGLKVFDYTPKMTLVSEEDRSEGRKWQVYNVNT